MAKVAFLGLGAMGGPMAGHLHKAGHELCVYNRNAAKAKAFVNGFGGRLSASIKDAVRGASFVFCCVGNDNDLAEVARQAFGAMQPGAIFIDHTTVSATITKQLALEAEAAGLAYMDAPVSGGQSGAEQGRLTIMCGGAPHIYEQSVPLLEAYAISHCLLGPVGSGQLCKMVNQICLAGVIQGLAEGLAFGERAGLDMEAVLKVISKGAAGSWQMENRGQTMVKREFDFGFAIDWMRKDLQICLAEAAKNGARLPITALIDQFYGDVAVEAGGRVDSSSLILRL